MEFFWRLRRQRLSLLRQTKQIPLCVEQFFSLAYTRNNFLFSLLAPQMTWLTSQTRSGLMIFRQKRLNVFFVSAASKVMEPSISIGGDEVCKKWTRQTLGGRMVGKKWKSFKPLVGARWARWPRPPAHRKKNCLDTFEKVTLWFNKNLTYRSKQSATVRGNNNRPTAYFLEHDI